MTLDFSGRVAIVTGAGRGLGRSHALDLARRGAKVVVNDLGAAVDGSGGSSGAADAVVDEIRMAGGEAISNGASVTDKAGVAGLVDQALYTFGRIDILINNAGILRDRSYSKMSDLEWTSVIDVHLHGSANMARAVWPHMREAGYGRIVMTSSSSGLYGNFGQANYGAAKMGVVGLAHTLAIEGQKDNIRVNAIAPVAWTRMTADLFPPDLEELFQPKKVTPAVIYLAGEEAPTNMILCAGGGAFAAARMEETKPIALGSEPSAEDVANAMDQIGNFLTADFLESGAEQTMRFIEVIKGNS